MESQQDSQFVPSEKILFRGYKRTAPRNNGLKDRAWFIGWEIGSGNNVKA